MSDPISERELEILCLIAGGASNDEIASQLYLAVGTVKWYNTQIYAKLGVKSRTQAIQRADQLGLLNKRQTPLARNQRTVEKPGSSNLPLLPTPVTGRETELAEISELLNAESTRLITLIGPGGIGKTVLAIEAAGRAKRQFHDGVYFISLAALASPDDIASTIAAALDFRPVEGIIPTQALIDALRSKTLLLAMDNFDSLIAGASVVKAILSAAPNVKILVTSRERLNIQEETVYRVGGLRIPNSASAEELLKNGAVSLFLTHTCRLRPDYRPNADDLQAIATICRLVEGMPLGIVLAAAWMEMLTPAEIAREISTSLDFLAFYSRDLPERHQSVRAVFASAWRRLSEVEQRIFARVSVFRGGFTRAAAEAVGAATLRDLMLLANKSLITRDAEGRYSTHPLLRQYAAEQLEITRTADETFTAHSRHYLEMLACYSGEGIDESDVAAQIAADFENIRAACVWAVDCAAFSAFDGAIDTLYAFCMRHSRYVDLISLLDRILEGVQKNDPSNIALIRRVREYRGRTLSLMGEFDGAIADLNFAAEAAGAAGDQALERELLTNLGQIFRKTERHNEAERGLGQVLRASLAARDHRAAADSLYHLGTVAWDEGDNVIAMRRHEQAYSIAHELGLRDLVGVQAAHGLGEAMVVAGQATRAYDLFNESLALAVEIGDLTYESENQQMLGWSSLGSFGTGHYDRARNHLLRSLEISESAGLQWHTIWSLFGLGLVHAASGDYNAGLACVRQGYEKAVRLHINRLTTQGLDLLGQLHQEMGELAQAEALHARSIEIMLREEATNWLPRAQANYAIALTHPVDLNVDALLDEALQTALNRHQEMHAIRCLEAQAELHLLRRDPQAVHCVADQIYRLAEPGGMREMIAQSYRWHGEAYVLEMNNAAAETAFDQARILALDVGNRFLIEVTEKVLAAT